MQAGKRHVLTFDRPPAVKSVLEELSEGVQSDGNIRREIRRGLEEFAKHGRVRLILDLQVIGPPLEGSSATIRNFSAFLAGDVLILTGQVTSYWMLRILQAKAGSRRHFLPKRLTNILGAVISTAAVEMQIAGQRIAHPFSRTRGNLGRVRIR